MKKKIIIYILIILVIIATIVVVKTEQNNLNLQYEILSNLPNDIKFDIKTKGTEIIEYNKEYYVIIKMGLCSTGGYDIKIKNIKTNSEKINIYVKTTKPRLEDNVTETLTYPYVVVKFKDYPNINIIGND